MTEPYQMSANSALLELKSTQKGLNDTEANERLKLHGPNTIAQEEKNKTLKLLVRNFNSLLIYILLGSALISYFSDHMIETIVIMVIILFTGLFGFIQEYHAGKSLEALSKLAVKQVDVIRNGKREQIKKEDLVKGDIAIITRGMIVPADMRIIENKGLSADEAILTGESLQKYKTINKIDKKEVMIADQNNMLFAGTSITSGQGKGLVVATGLESEIGKISLSLASIGHQKSPLQKQIDKMSQKIAYAVLGLCAVLFIVLMGQRMELYEALILVGAMAVSGIPESFPLALTMGLSNGVKRMAKKNAIIKDLSAVETLGTTTVICTDKTGTLTENKMIVERVIFADGVELDAKGYNYDPTSTFMNKRKAFSKQSLAKYPDFFRTCILCNNAAINIKNEEWKLSGEPTEGALLAIAKSAGFDDEVLRKQNKQVNEIPFDPTEKYMVSVNQEGKEKTAYLKGAVERVLDKCSHIRTKRGVVKLDRKKKVEIISNVHHHTNQAYRVIGLATKKANNGLDKGYTYEGFVAISDPIREQAYGAVEECQSANIRVVMITGDHKHTAKSVGKRLGIVKTAEDLILEGWEVDKMSDEELDSIILKVAIFSRTTPEHKLRIVSSLQRQNQIVAMTGDGVNDAPALKKADIGVSMGKSGTEVAREASNMVLTDDQFSTIVNAVKEGRTIYSNIRRFIYYLLTGNMTEVCLIMFSVLAGILMPLTALMVLFINLVTSTPPALSLSIEKTHMKVMKQRPRNPEERILSQYILLKIFVLIPILFAGVMALFLWELKIAGGGIARAQTMAFVTLIMFELMHTFNARSLHTTIFDKRFFDNKYIFVALAVSMTLTLLAVYTPLGQTVFNTVPLTFMEWGIILAVSSLVIVVAEVIKALVRSEFMEQKRLKGIDMKVE